MSTQITTTIPNNIYQRMIEQADRKQRDVPAVARDILLQAFGEMPMTDEDQAMLR